MVAFGWSVGDLFAAIHFLKEVVEALDESKGSKPEYQMLMKEIYGLERTLVIIDPLELSDTRQQEQEPIKGYQSLSSGPSSLKDHWLKAKWALGHESKVQKFREALGQRVAALNLLLSTINLAQGQSMDRNVNERFAHLATLTADVQTRMSDGNVEQNDLLRRIENLLLEQKSQLAPPQDSESKPSRFVVRPLKLTGAPLAPALVQREEVMKGIEQSLLPTALGQQRILVLQGMGGVGKSQMAREYAKSHQDSYTAVFWVNAKFENSLKSDLVSIARRIGWKDVMSDPEQSTASAISALQEWLDEDDNMDWLLIFDNVDSKVAPDLDEKEVTQVGARFDICDCLPSTPHGTILVTSRLPYRARQIGGTSHVVDQMTLRESLDVICKLSGLQPQTPGAEALVKKLGFYPLALSQAGRYIRETQISFVKYLDIYETRFMTLFQQKLSPREYPHGSIDVALGLSYEALKPKDPGAAALVGLSDQERYDSAIDSLVEFPFVRRNANSNGVSVHRIVHQWTLTLYSEQTKFEYLEAAANLISWEYLSEDLEEIPLGFLRLAPSDAIKLRLRPHAERIVGLLGRKLDHVAWDAATFIESGAYPHHEYWDMFRTAQRLLDTGRRRLDEQTHPMTEIETVKAVQLRCLLDIPYSNSRYRNRCLWSVEEQLVNLESARATLRSRNLPRNDRWLMYEIYAIWGIYRTRCYRSQYQEAKEAIDQAMEEHRASGVRSVLILYLESWKVALRPALEERDVEDVICCCQQIIARLEVMLRDSPPLDDSLFNKTETLRRVPMEAYWGIGYVHLYDDNYEEAEICFSHAMIKAQEICSSDPTTIKIARYLWDVRRMKGSTELELAWPVPQLLNTSTSKHLSTTGRPFMTNGVHQKWDSAINSVRTLVRYRPRTR